ncbi:MAG: hypothetical protein DRN49_01305 [Thaumarchaeota archaeon]|nr:MAG: hypothetical protein DRN49_01305 [Nitrososphaerota archaeon]
MSCSGLRKIHLPSDEEVLKEIAEEMYFDVEAADCMGFDEFYEMLKAAFLSRSSVRIRVCYFEIVKKVKGKVHVITVTNYFKLRPKQPYKTRTIRVVHP